MHRDARGVPRTLLLSLLLSSSVGCSFFGQHPLWAPIERTKKATASCADIHYPIADGLSVVAGATWVYSAARDEKNNRTSTTEYDSGDAFNPPMTRVVYSEPRSTAWTRFERTFGYSAMAVFGVSAIYGLIAQTRCSRASKEFEAQTKARATRAVPSRSAFPSGVFAFRFDMSPARAEQACRSMGRRWHQDGAQATCVIDAPTAAQADIRLEFQFGVASVVVVGFAPAATQLTRDYDSLEHSLRTLYGRPQVERAPLGAACTDSLVRCLADGERPRGPLWHWPGGSIELTLTRRGDAAAIELRYSREDPGSL